MSKAYAVCQPLTSAIGYFSTCGASELAALLTIDK